MLNIKFSIITPSYNGGDRLKDAHYSLHSNKCDYEHIIIDDFSEDDSLRNLVECKEAINIVPIWLDRNSGPGNARNVGLDIATGDYVIFLDSDDALEVGALDIIAKQVSKASFPDLILFDYSIIKTKKTGVGCETARIDLLNNNELMHDFMIDKIISAPWCKCIKSSIAKQSRFPDLRVQQDSLYNFSVFQNCNVTIKINRRLYNFDKSFTGSLTTKPFTKTEMLKFFESWLAFEYLVNNSRIHNAVQLLAIRKIKFCCLYYINRLADSPFISYDSYIKSVIKKTFIENIINTKHGLTFKAQAICILFIISPWLAITLIRLVR